MSRKQSSSRSSTKRKYTPNPAASRFKQHSPVNLQSFEQHLDNLHLMGQRENLVLVPGQQYNVRTASPIPPIEVRLERAKESAEESGMKKEDSSTFTEQEDTFGQFVTIDRGGKRKKRRTRKTKKKIRKTRRKKSKSKRKRKSKSRR